MSLKEINVKKYHSIYKVVRVVSGGREIPTGKYRVRRRIKSGSRWTTKVSTCNSLIEAKRIAKEDLGPCHENGFTEGILFSDAFDRFLWAKEFEEKLAPGTISGYRSRARHFEFFSVYKMAEMDSKLVDSWANLMLDPEYIRAQPQLRKDYSHELSLLSAFFNHFRDFHADNFKNPIRKRHRLRLNPKRKGKDEIRFLQPDEEERFLEALKDKPLFLDMARIQLLTGMRIGEVAALVP